MSVWNQRTVFEYTSDHAPELTFYYVPLEGDRQVQFRRRRNEFKTMYDFLESVFARRLLVFRVDRDGEKTKTFSWPPEDPSQEVLFMNIPEKVVMEVGAAMLGWRKSSDEALDQFLDRISDGLDDSIVV